MIASGRGDVFTDSFRGIAQSGSAPALGAGCREFKSLYPDHLIFLCTMTHFRSQVGVANEAQPA